MATIGMDKLYYAKITEDSNGEETYGVPISMAKAIRADITIELAEANLFADDGLAYVINLVDLLVGRGGGSKPLPSGLLKAETNALFCKDTPMSRALI